MLRCRQEWEFEWPSEILVLRQEDDQNGQVQALFI